MTSREVHITSAIPVAFLAVALGHHPIVVLPLLAGTLLPEVDTVEKRFHRSWLLHTFLAPALAYAVLERTGLLSPALVTGIHFVTVGMALHFAADYLYPRTATHVGSRWPVRPVFVSAPWGLLWFGIAWTVQWFLYLSASFIPWLFGLTA